MASIAAYLVPCLPFRQAVDHFHSQGASCFLRVRKCLALRIGDPQLFAALDAILLCNLASLNRADVCIGQGAAATVMVEAKRPIRVMVNCMLKGGIYGIWRALLDDFSVGGMCYRLTFAERGMTELGLLR